MIHERWDMAKSGMTHGTIAVGSKRLLFECMDMHHMLLLLDTTVHCRHSMLLLNPDDVIVPLYLGALPLAGLECR